MHGSVSDRSFCAFVHRVAFEEVSGHRVLLKSGPVSRGNSRHSIVGGVTCRNTPISRPTLEKNPMPGHLFEGNPVDKGTKRRVTDTPVHHSVKAAGSTHRLSRALRPPERLKGQAEFRYSDKTRPDSPVPTLQGPCGRCQKWRGSLRFLPPIEMRPSFISSNLVESREAPLTPQYPSPLRGTWEVP